MERAIPKLKNSSFIFFLADDLEAINTLFKCEGNEMYSYI